MAEEGKLTDLAKKIYGASDERVKELEQMYNATEIEIEGIISRFISDDDNWSLPAPITLKRRLLAELKGMYQQAGGDDKALISASMSNRKLTTITDAVKVSAGIVLLKLAQKRRQQLADSLKSIPRLVQQNSYKQAPKRVRKQFVAKYGRQPTPIEHEYELARKYPGSYHKPLAQNSASKMVRNYGSGIDTNASINRDTISVMNKVNDMVSDILKNHRKPQDYRHDLADIITGGKSSKGALGNAERLLRTESAFTFAHSIKDDYKKRGVKYFTNQANLGPHTCKFCERMDGKTFKVSEMQPGVNCFPFHPNCQCDIIEATKDDIESASDTVLDDSDIDE